MMEHTTYISRSSESWRIPNSNFLSNNSKSNNKFNKANTTPHTMLMLNYTHTLLALLPLFAIASPMTIAKRASDVLIVSNKDGKCLAVGTGPIQNGTPVLGVECQVAPGWDINYGSGSIVLSGTEYAVDIGLNPQDHGQLHVSF